MSSGSTLQESVSPRNARRRAGVDLSVTRPFALTFDYRCPWARIVHNYVIAGLKSGADWDVTFAPFSLGQVHVAEGETDIWRRPDEDSGLLALQASIAVRDGQADRFLDVHHALFDHRHVAGGDLRRRDVLSEVLEPAGVDVDAVWTDVDSGHALATVEKEHTAYADSHTVWGVPTFVVGERAVFVRLHDIDSDDPAESISMIERILDNIEWAQLNEFKHTTIPR